MAEPIITITFTDEDVLDLADEADIDHEVALDRARSYAKAITETAVSNIDALLDDAVRGLL